MNVALTFCIFSFPRETSWTHTTTTTNFPTVLEHIIKPPQKKSGCPTRLPRFPCSFCLPSPPPAPFSSLGNDRGTGNTVCFWPGVHWGTGAVLHFDTCTLTITLRGFYTVFGHTPDGVRNFISYPQGGRGTPHSLFMLVLNRCFTISMASSMCMKLL